MSEDLEKAITNARNRAAKAGSLHALWDVILDAEAWASGRATLAQWGTGADAERALIVALNR